jgi:hypothetical protein
MKIKKTLLRDLESHDRKWTVQLGRPLSWGHYCNCEVVMDRRFDINCFLPLTTAGTAPHHKTGVLGAPALHIRKEKRTYIHTHTYIRTYVHIYIHTRIIHAYIHTHMHTYIRTCMHVYIHTRTHIYTSKSWWKFEVVTALKMSMLVSWAVLPCGTVRRYKRFERTYCLHLQVRFQILTGSWRQQARRSVSARPHEQHPGRQTSSGSYRVATHKTKADVLKLIMQLKQSAFNFFKLDSCPCRLYFNRNFYSKQSSGFPADQ